MDESKSLVKKMNKFRRKLFDAECMHNSFSFLFSLMVWKNYALTWTQICFLSLNCCLIAYQTNYVFCISTRVWVLHTLFTGEYHFLTLKQLFPPIFVNKVKVQKITKKQSKKRVYQRLDVTLKSWLTPKSCSCVCMFLCGFPFFCSLSDRKSVLAKLILTSERHAEHPFSGRNTQQLCLKLTAHLAFTFALKHWSTTIFGMNLKIICLWSWQNCAV